MSGDGLYFAGRYSQGLGGRYLPGFIERRSLDGAQVWRIEALDLASHLVTDGADLYYTTDASTLARVSFDGEVADWSLQLPYGGGKAGLVFGPNDQLLVYGSHTAHPGDPDFEDGVVRLYDKIDGGLPIDTFFYGDENENERASEAIFASGSGFHVVYTGDPYDPEIAIQSYLGARPIQVDLDINGTVTSFLERPDGLLVGGTESDQAWLSKVDEGGEVWRKQLQLCGEAPAWLGDLRQVGDQLWGHGSIEVGDKKTFVIVQLDLEGGVLGVSKVAGLDPAAIGRLAPKDGDTVVAAGVVMDGPDAGKGWLARLR